MALIIRTTAEPHRLSEVKLVPTSHGQWVAGTPKPKFVEMTTSFRNEHGKIVEITVKLNALEAETLAQGLRASTR